MGRRFARSSLARLIGFTGLTSLLLVLASVIVMTVHERHRLATQAERETRTLSFFLADHASRLFEAADFALRQADRRVELMRWDEIAGARPLWGELSSLVDELPYIYALFLTDGSGRLRLTTAEFPPPATNSADRDWFVAQLEPNEALYVGHLLVGRVSHKPTFVLSRRLATPNGGFRGVVAASAELDYFGSFWSRAESRFAPNVTLFRADDLDVLAQHPPASDRTDFLPAQFATLDDVIAANPQFATMRIDAGDAPDGQSRILSYRKVGSFPLYLSVSVRQDAIDAVWWSEVLPFLLFGAAAVLALAGLASFAFRQARRDAQSRTMLAHIVEERTAALSAATSQLQTLLDELNHRVKNNLQVVTSLLRLQSQRSDDPRLRRSLDDSVQRIQAMAMLHQQLSVADAQSELAFGSYLQALTGNLAEAYGASDRVRIEVQVENACLDLQTATPVALIVNEVVSNALKYAFPDGRRGTILVRLVRRAGACELVVEDDGVGLPPNLDWRQASGLGMRIVRALCDQLEGAAEYDSDGGTRFRLRFGQSGEAAAV